MAILPPRVGSADLSPALGEFAAAARLSLGSARRGHRTRQGRDRARQDGVRAVLRTVPRRRARRRRRADASPALTPYTLNILACNPDSSSSARTRRPRSSERSCATASHRCRRFAKQSSRTRTSRPSPTTSRRPRALRRVEPPYAAPEKKTCARAAAVARRVASLHVNGATREIGSALAARELALRRQRASRPSAVSARAPSPSLRKFAPQPAPATRQRASRSRRARPSSRRRPPRTTRSPAVARATAPRTQRRARVESR
jgi:hypothetical protein